MVRKLEYPDGVKTCKKCGETKELGEFYFIKTEQRYRSACRICENARTKSLTAAWYEKNREINNRKRNEKRAFDPEHRRRILEQDRKQREIRRADRVLEARIRAGLQKEVTPNWADRSKIREIYLEAKRLTKETGTLYTVDHVVPLKNLSFVDYTVKQTCEL